MVGYRYKTQKTCYLRDRVSVGFRDKVRVSVLGLKFTFRSSTKIIHNKG